MRMPALRRVAVGATSLALATLVAVGGTGLPATALGDSAAQGSTAPVAAATPPDPALALAVAQWVTNGGQTQLEALAKDFKALEKSANTDDMTAIGISCSQLQTDVESAQAYDPIPDPQAQHDWADALADYARGATDCVAGTRNPTTPSADLITAASTEIMTGSTDLNKVTARLTEITG